MTVDMDTSSSYSYENDCCENDYDTFNQLHDFGYDSLSASHFDGCSETSEEFFSIYEQTSTDSYFDEYDDDLSSNYSIFETDSSIDDFQSGSGNTSIRRPSELSILSRRREYTEAEKPALSGILKHKDISIPNIIPRETIEKIRENELEDVLQHARDIVEPDPAAKVTYRSQPAKVVQGSFKHLLSVKEVNSKTGAFSHRTIEMTRNVDEDLGFSIREGDGWEKKGGIFISRVALGSVFDQYGILTIGDEILMINKVDIRNMKVDDVVRLMYIPQRLSMTVKMLTPFSKKRVADTKIDSKRSRTKHLIPKPVSDNFYKVAQLQIGSKKRESGKPGKTILVKNKKMNNEEEVLTTSTSKKISPYRTMDGGKLPPVKPKTNLSPIREGKSEGKSLRNRRASYVTWSDQKT